MFTRTLSLRACLALAAAFACAGCSDGGLTRPEPEPEPGSLAISVAEGAGQQAEVATELPHPLVVQVRDAAGAPVRGVVVEWSALRGTSPAAVSTTDASGRASTRWMLSTTAAPDSVVARIKDTEVAVRIAVRAWPGPAFRLATLDSVRLYWYNRNMVVRAFAWDQYGNAVPTDGVRWTALDPAYAGVEGTGGEVRLAPVSPGRARMVAWMGALADTMIASVMHDIAFLEVTPFRLRAMVGDSIPFSVVGIGAGYALREAPVSWSVEGSAISLIPTGDSRAVGIALAPGRVTVGAALRWEPPLYQSVVIEVVAAASDWTSVSAGAGYNCGLTARAAAFCWGANHNDFTATDTWDRCFGGGCNITPTPVRGGLAFASITPGVRTICGLTTDGRAYCWGGNAFGQIGNNDVTQITVDQPQPMAGDVRFSSLTLGSTHTCGLDAQGIAYCWGGNQLGEVGAAGAQVMANPLPLPVSGGLAFRQLAAGGFRTCGITTAGEAYCWGEYIGPAPTRVQGGPAFARVTLSGRHMCALTPAGEAWCWGLNNAGELGLGSTALSSTTAPVRVVGGHRFVSLSAGGWFTCAVDDAGAAWCWGEDMDGKLGNGGADQSVGTPTRVAGNHGFRSVTAGVRHACALATDGSAFCWGNGYGGTLGNGGRDHSSVPVRVSVP